MNKTQPWVLDPAYADESLQLLKKTNAQLVWGDGRKQRLDEVFRDGAGPETSAWDLEIHKVNFRLPGNSGGRVRFASDDCFVWLLSLNNTPYAGRVWIQSNELSLLAERTIGEPSERKMSHSTLDLIHLIALGVGYAEKKSSSGRIIPGASHSPDLSPLAGLKALKHLVVHPCSGLIAIGPLASLGALESLDLCHCESLTDLSPLAGLSMLTSLNLSRCENLTDLTPLAGLTALTSLDLSSCENLTDLSPLAGLTALTRLDLRGCSNLADLSPLAGLTALSRLDLSRCEKLTDLSPLAGLQALTTLGLSGCHSCPN
jgi:hypothetical protein